MGLLNNLFGKKGSCCCVEIVEEPEDDCCTPGCCDVLSSACCEKDTYEDGDACGIGPEGCCSAADNACCGAVSKELSIKVLGAGCKNCHTLENNVNEALAQMGLSIKAEHVDDVKTIVGYGVMAVPALVVNEKVVSCGKVLKPEEIVALLNEYK